MERGKRGERFFRGAIAPPQAAEGAQFCKLPPETRAFRKAVARRTRKESKKAALCSESQADKAGRRQGGLRACPVAGKILRARIGASAIRSLEYFPFGRAAHALRPAALSAATGAWLGVIIRHGGCR